MDFVKDLVRTNCLFWWRQTKPRRTV